MNQVGPRGKYSPCNRPVCRKEFPTLQPRVAVDIASGGPAGRPKGRCHQIPGVWQNVRHVQYGVVVDQVLPRSCPPKSPWVPSE